MAVNVNPVCLGIKVPSGGFYRVSGMPAAQKQTFTGLTPQLLALIPENVLPASVRDQIIVPEVNFKVRSDLLAEALRSISPESIIRVEDEQGFARTTHSSFKEDLAKCIKAAKGKTPGQFGVVAYISRIDFEGIKLALIFTLGFQPGIQMVNPLYFLEIADVLDSDEPPEK